MLSMLFVIALQGVPQGLATPQLAAPPPLRRRVQRHSGVDALYSADVWDPLPSGQNVEEFLAEDAAYFANNRGKFAAFVAVLVVLHLIPIVKCAALLLPVFFSPTTAWSFGNTVYNRLTPPPL
jgi:hypothetical protein